MKRLTRRPALAFAANGSVPPLPHPSWFDGERLRAAAVRPVAPEEFWRKLGL